MTVPASAKASHAGLSPGRSPRRGSDFAELSRLIRRDGLLRRRPGYYAMKITIVVLLYAAGWAAVVALGASWYQLLVAVYLAVIFGQLGFLGHEAGHRQIFRSRRGNDITGLVLGDLLIGLSFGWWTGKHNRHHAHPNQVGKDPDIGIPVLAFTADQAAGPARPAPDAGPLPGPAVLPHAAAGSGEHACDQHFGRAARRCAARYRPAGRRWLERGLLLAHFAGYLTVVALVMSPAQAVAFIAVQQGLLGVYLGCAFAPNHKGMPVLSEQDNLDFLRRQVLTSRNVTGGPLVETLLGGLNYQIEHHLFPSMPRPSLRRCRSLVRAFCAQHELPYHELNLAASYAQVLRALHAAGES